VGMPGEIILMSRAHAKTLAAATTNPLRKMSADCQVALWLGSDEADELVQALDAALGADIEAQGIAKAAPAESFGSSQALSLVWALVGVVSIAVFAARACN
jgi:hypothetical protein